MTETIKTESIAKNCAKTGWVLLEQTSTTALVFKPLVHSNGITDGVRGELVRYKKNNNQTWEQLPPDDFRKLKLHEGARIELSTEALIKLEEEVKKRREILKDGISFGHNEYLVLKNSNDLKGIVDTIKEKGLEPELISSLIERLNPETLDNLVTAQIHAKRIKVVDELYRRLTETYHEIKGEDSWQQWIYAHSWLFGVRYHKPIKMKISVEGKEPDCIFPTTDGFVDILEIKLPTAKVIEYDNNHVGSWVWSRDATFAIGQVVNYLSAIEDYKLHLEKNLNQGVHKISMLKPRAYILIGTEENWSSAQKDGLRKLNHSLNGIEILTYTELIRRGEAQTKLQEPDGSI